MADTNILWKKEKDVRPQSGTANDQPSENANRKSSEEPPKKKRRVVKPNPDKKFECRYQGCPKTYSRAEHLYRHQLNHTPKTIYRCDFPDCQRYFVRQDLCIRHRERHTTQGSQLHKRDSFTQSSTNQHRPNLSTEPPLGPNTTYPMSAPSLKSPREKLPALQKHSRKSSNDLSPLTASNEPRFHPPTPQGATKAREPQLRRTSSHESDHLSPAQNPAMQTWMPLPRKQSSSNGEATCNPVGYGDGRHSGHVHIASVPQSPVREYSSSSATNHEAVMAGPNSAYNRSSSNGYVQTSDMTTVPYNSASYHESTVTGSDAFAAAISNGLTRGDPYPYAVMNSMSGIDMSSGFGFPIFGGDEYTVNPNPFAVADEFTQWLFDSKTQPTTTSFSPSSYMASYDGQEVHTSVPYLTQSPTMTAAYPAVSQHHPMSVTSLLLDHHPTNHYIMSESKRHQLLDLIQNQFVERPHDAVKKRKDSVFEGNIDSEGHILSLRMMHTYIGSYWYHQHAQLPILHKPTFSADQTPNLLLLAVIAVGAATLDKAYGTSLTDSAAEFANFVAWHIRWEIVRDEDFRPPAKLWVFQTLLLIEVYEKMYATRALHERAHIHHDSTLTLMRRGSSLLGRSASDSPPSLRGEQDNGKISVPFSAADSSKSEESWHRWITTEATRRAAFGAFVIDSIHATMFGHAAKMVAHEMRLPLPCDEGLWSAVSPSEAGRVQQSLQTNGVKPAMFLDGLKRTLNGHRVRTNSFGRTIIMAGLLSVSWHMAQRDLQMTSLGPGTTNSFGGRDKWKGTLLRAFDNWKRDFDEALAESAPSPPAPLPNPSAPLHSLLRPVDDENIFESRTVLHHLAHIAAHVDVVDCQVFAGANRLLGRSITPKDYSIIREKIERWATKASARDAAFYALKFIAQVLTPPADGGDGFHSQHYGHASHILPQAFDQNVYVARDDFLLNRPWVLYISALVVWCYGFALEGAIKPAPKDEDFQTYKQKEADMKDYMIRVAGVRAPDDLVGVEGKNRCLGLLMILKESFESTRWELTHEAAGLLGNACLKLRGVEEEIISEDGKNVPTTSELNGHATKGHSNGHGSFNPNSDGGRGHPTVASAAKV